MKPTPNVKDAKEHWVKLNSNPLTNSRGLWSPILRVKCSTTKTKLIWLTWKQTPMKRSGNLSSPNWGHFGSIFSFPHWTWPFSQERDAWVVRHIVLMIHTVVLWIIGGFLDFIIIGILFKKSITFNHFLRIMLTNTRYNFLS